MLGALAALLALPFGLARAECSFTQSCGGGHGAHTHRFASSSECESKLAETRRWNASVGGGCSFTSCSCSGSRGSEPGIGLPSGMGTREAFTSAMGQAAVNTLANDFARWLTTSEVAEGRKRREVERLAALERQRLADLENKCRKREAETKFKVDKAELMGGFRGEIGGSTATSAGLGFRNLDSIDPSTRRAETYTHLERERRDALAGSKADPVRLDWCKKHIPLCPTRPAQEAWSGHYDAMMGSYAEKMTAWEAYCQGGAPPAQFAGAGAGGGLAGYRDLERAPAPPPRPRPAVDKKALEEKQTAAVDCAMAPALKRAAGMGAKVERLLSDSRDELDAFMRELRENHASGKSETFKLFSEGIRHTEVSEDKDSELEFKALATRRESDGQLSLHVDYRFTSKRGTSKALQNLLILDREGRVLAARLSTDIGNDTRECLRPAFPEMTCKYLARSADCREPGTGPLE
ncbi:MAG: hypothetical protein HY553_19125 [Elusimicrobia bacterium]|nr:hypothetical protein [Elusimicrobiota bacterium]